MVEREGLIRELFAEALDRVLRNEDPDPCTALVGALLRKEEVADRDLALILEAHRQGPWVVNDPDKFEVFERWVQAAGASLQIPSEVENVHRTERLYRGDYGECCLREASRYEAWAMWTRKSRLHIGFADQADAEFFRSQDPRFSLESTGNKRVNLVVIEGGDTPEMIHLAGSKLYRLRVHKGEHVPLFLDAS